VPLHLVGMPAGNAGSVSDGFSTLYSINRKSSRGPATCHLLLAKHAGRRPPLYKYATGLSPVTAHSRLSVIRQRPQRWAWWSACALPSLNSCRSGRRNPSEWMDIWDDVATSSAGNSLLLNREEGRAQWTLAYYTRHPNCTSRFLARGGDGVRDGVGRERLPKVSRPQQWSCAALPVSLRAARVDSRASARPTLAAAAHAPLGRGLPAPAGPRQPPSGAGPPGRRAAGPPRPGGLRRGETPAGGDVCTPLRQAGASLRSSAKS